MSRWAAGQTSVRATGRLSTAVRLAGVGHPGERLGQVQDLSGPDDLLSLGEQLLEDGSPHLRLEKVRRDGLRCRNSSLRPVESRSIDFMGERIRFHHVEDSRGPKYWGSRSERITPERVKGLWIFGLLHFQKSCQSSSAGNASKIIEVFHAPNVSQPNETSPDGGRRRPEFRPPPGCTSQT